jgi:hypothetical protein
MSKEAVREVIAKAVADAEFREMLLNNPEQALMGFDLSDVEREEFNNLKVDDFDLDAQELEDRISRWGDPMGGGI